MGQEIQAEGGVKKSFHLSGCVYFRYNKPVAFLCHVYIQRKFNGKNKKSLSHGTDKIIYVPHEAFKIDLWHHNHFSEDSHKICGCCSLLKRVVTGAGFFCLLQRLPVTCNLPPSKHSDKAEFQWTSIKEKPLKLF